MLKLLRLPLFLLVASAALAQTTPVLVPVFYNGPGAYGSEWFTTVAVNNFSSQTIEGHGLETLVRCPIPEGCERTRFIAGDVGYVTGPQSSSGFLLYLPAAETRKVELDVRFGEVTRNQYGVELPVAREEDFRHEPVVLPYVRLTGYGNELRTTVRIFSPDAIPGQQVRVEIRLQGQRPEDAPMGSRDLTLALTDPPNTPEPMRPAYAELVLQQAFPENFNGYASVRVVPLPLAGDAVPRIWAMATSVRNDNNEVAVYSPQ